MFGTPGPKGPQGKPNRPCQSRRRWTNFAPAFRHRVPEYSQHFKHFRSYKSHYLDSTLGPDNMAPTIYVQKQGLPVRLSSDVPVELLRARASTLQPGDLQAGLRCLALYNALWSRLQILCKRCFGHMHRLMLPSPSDFSQKKPETQIRNSTRLYTA